MKKSRLADKSILSLVVLYLIGLARAAKDSLAFAGKLAIKPSDAAFFATLAPIAGADDGTVPAAVKELGEEAHKLREDLFGRLKEMDATAENKQEVEKREKELGEKVDKLIDLAGAAKSAEVEDFEERLERFEKQMEKFGQGAARGPAGATDPASLEARAKARYESPSGGNFFLDKLNATKGDARLQEALRDHEAKHNSPEHQKAWASGDLEAASLVVPEVQEALPFLAAQAKVVQLCREIRTNSPAVEFPVYKTGLSVAHAAPTTTKTSSTPTFDLETARVYTIAGLTEVPNQTLEDFPAARGWISSELGRATGAQEEVDVLSGTGVSQPLGILANTDVPHRDADAVVGASIGRNAISSIFRGAQQVRTTGFTEPTDVVLNPAIWTDVVLSFEGNIGYLYGPPSGGDATQAPPARILGLPVTWSSYVPMNLGDDDNESPVIVGNFQDAIVLRRSPFRIDVDTSLGFKVNTTWFRGEERMGFIVVRPGSFVVVDGLIPSPVA